MFTLQLQTKPYVHHFLSSNFGNPADLSTDKQLHTLFRRCLKKPSTRFHSKYHELSMTRYSQQSQIIITEDDFYRYGWEMTKTDTVLFGRELENRVKFMMRNIISMYMTFMPQKNAILMFQENFGYQEEVWSFESIKKDYFRNAPEHKVSFLEEITRKSEHIILANLSDLGTISRKLLKDHERNQQTA